MNTGGTKPPIQRFSVKRFLVILLVFRIWGVTSGGAEVSGPPHFDDEGAPGILAVRIVNAMSDAEALGQILMFGYPGDAPDPGIMRWIREAGLGGVKVFGWNAENLERLAETVGVYQGAARSSRFGVPLLIATDQEGGWVRHVKGSSSVTPGNMALGANPIPADAFETGRIIGRELAAVGVNMNFAPTIDVFVDPRADVIGPRAFTADPHWAGILGSAFAKGQEEFGVISTAKHFPGHGDTADDSHGTLPVVLAGLDTLRERDLVPYRTMIASGLPAVMAGHLAFPTVTGNRLPATLSRDLLTDLLRGELGFEGVTITDDLFMDGARTDGAPLDEVCYRAVRAGADILLVSQGPGDHRRIHRRLLDEMEREAGFRARVREAARRVIRMKVSRLRGEGAVPFFPSPAEEAIPAPGTGEFLLAQAARSITLVRSGRFPVLPEEAGDVLLAGNHAYFFSEGLRRYPEAKRWYLGYEDTEEELRRGERVLAGGGGAAFDTVIALVSDEKSAMILDELESLGDKVVLISVLSPAHLDRLMWAETSIAAYGRGRESFRAAFAALAGDFVPEGRLPIPLESAGTGRKADSAPGKTGAGRGER